jgi:hypothetical protein
VPRNGKRPPGAYHRTMRSALALLTLTAALLPPGAQAASTDRALAFDRSGRQDANRPLPWFGIRLGGAVAVGSPADDTPTAGGASLYALFDGRDFLADVALDVYGGDRAHLIALGLGAYYPFIPANVTPYLGGGLKAGWTRFGGDGTFGLIPFAAAGLLIGREGYIQVRAELAWFVAVSREDRGDRPQGSARATGPLMTLGLAF